MKNIIDIFPYNQINNSSSKVSVEEAEKYLNNFWQKNTVVLSSAMAGIYAALKFSGLKRTDHILVPEFLCQTIHYILNTSSFPVKYFDSRTKVMLLLHQWGYPQDLDKVLPLAKKNNLFIIEDCAHSIDSQYKGQNIGSFGDLAVFSFAKTMGTCIGGALISDNEKIIDYVKNFRAQKKGLSNHLFNILVFKAARKHYFEDKRYSILDLIYLKSIDFPNISSKALNLFPPNIETLKKILQKRKANYEFIKKNIKQDYLTVDNNPDINVNPLCVPVFLPVNKIETAKKQLRENGFFVEILHFDVNRNIFEPNYQKCLALPCHQQLTSGQLGLMIEIINYI
jgi:dTDP-4-amino-4,6-dideoxygalactose transaminase